MNGKKIVHNGTLSLIEDASFALDDTDITYGYGCYETLKVRESVLFFPEFHAQRLINSAAILGIANDLSERALIDGLNLLVRANDMNDCNIKVMLIGHDERLADWYAMTLPALHPPAGASESGVPCCAFRGERHFPQAKSLSMLLSTVAYRRACALGCYDALLVNRRNEITEGSRTNVFFAHINNPRVLLTPPAQDVLSGITRKTFMLAMDEKGWQCREAALDLDAVLNGQYGLMVSSTSTRLVPVSALYHAEVEPKGGVGNPEERPLPVRLPIIPEMREAVDVYSIWLDRYAKGF